MDKLFEINPKIENSRYRIRLVRKKDLIELLEIYSNKENLKFINVDDCNGEDFYFPTIEMLEKKYEFWKYAYKKKWFIRMTIISKNDNRIIGTIELMKIISFDSFDGDILLRLDLKSKCEQSEIIKEVITLIKEKLISDCSYKKIITKSTKDMSVRTNALIDLGFKYSNRLLLGKEDNKLYKDYYVKKK